MSGFDQFKDTYFNECFELLSSMEEKLLGIDLSVGADLEELNAIFRCIHSIKGGGGAFGLDEIVGFTHIAEALLDVMRDGKVPATQGAIDALLRSVDVTSQMIRLAKENKPVPADMGKDLSEELQGLASASGQKIAAAKTKQKEKTDSDITKFYRIIFNPHRSMLLSGNEPLLILRELKRLGDLKVKTDISAVPTLDNLKPDDAYFTYVIDLQSAASLETVKEAFEFVDGECTLEIAIEAGIDSEIEAAPQQEAAPKTTAQKQEAGGAVNTATSIRVDIDKVDKLVNMVGEIVIIQAMLAAQSRHLELDKHQELIQGIEDLLQHTRELQEAVMSVRMQPLKSVFSRMPRIVRDIAVQLGKDIRLVTTGENTEVDKTVIELLSDPLTHMIRNSADHGVETPQIRTAAGKPAQGTINLSADSRGGRIIIEINDDGAGINREKVLAKAKDKGLVAKDAVLKDEEIDNLVFLPGFSTADKVSNISGRGVGMDVVRRNIEGLGGALQIINSPSKGCRFIVSIPLTLAILDGMIVRVGIENYIIPIGNIIETMRPKREDVKKIAGGNDVINVRGEFIPVMYLANMFGTRGGVLNAAEALVVLVESGRNKIGLVVDELIGQQQVVIKTLETNSDPVEGISGATILGDGKVSLILDVGKFQQLSHQPEQNLVAA